MLKIICYLGNANYEHSKIHFIPTEWSKLKRQPMSSAGEGLEQLEPPDIVVRAVKQDSACGKTLV